jgi:hypothetical protein
MANSIWDEFPTSVDFNKNAVPIAETQEAPANAASWEDFPDAVDFTNPAQPKKEPKHRLDKLRNMTHLEFMELPFAERAEISRELAEASKVDVGANLIEGLIPGGSELVAKAREEGYLPQEAQEGAAHYGLGSIKAVGMAAPITAISKGVNLLAKPFEQGIKQAGKHAKRIADYTKAAITGGAYKSASTAIGEQRAPTPGEVAGEVAMFAGGHGLGEAIGKAYRYFRGTGKQPADITAQEITQQLFGPDADIPPSMYETSEKIINGLKSQEAGIQTGGPQISPTAVFPASKTSQAPSLQGKVSREAPTTKATAKTLGVKVKPQVHNASPEEKALSTFRHEIENPYEAGKGIKESVKKADEAAYKVVNENYAKSDDLQKNISTIHTDLVGKLEGYIAEIDAIPSPSSIQKKLKSEMQTVIKELAEVGEDGVITGYKEMSNHQLLEQAKAWRQVIDYDFAHGDPQNIFKPAIKEVENAVLEAAKSSGNKDAVKALETAKESYKEWADTFNNDYINPFRDRSNKSYQRNFERLLNPDDYNVMKRVLEKTPEGKVQLEAIQREIVDKELKDILRNPRKINPRDLERKLSELKSILEPEQLQSIRDEIMKARAPQQMGFKGKKISKEEALNAHVAKVLKLEPEDLMSKMNSRTGIREVQKLAETAKELNQFDILKKQKSRDIVYKGNLEAKPTGTQIAERLNIAKNRELFVEMWGEEVYQAAYDAAKLLGEKEATPQVWKEVLKKAAVKGAKIHYLGTLAALIL